MENSIVVEHLVKRYKKSEKSAVDDISFEVKTGEFFTLLGPNGAGKTTTISILTTILSPTSGTIHVANYDIVREASKVRENVGIIFQKPSLDQNLTAEENVRFHAVLYGLYPFRPTFSMMPHAYKKQIADLASILGIEKEIFKPIKQFSGGMKRKLEIIRSLIHRPQILFLDEPTTGLDPISRRNLWEYLHQVRNEYGTTVFLTTHYLEEAEEADKVCIINEGKVISFGSPADIKADLAKEYLYLDAEDHAALRDELNSMHIPFTEIPQFQISTDGLSAYKIIKSLQVPLTLMQTHTPTLEDAYLKIVEHES